MIISAVVAMAENHVIGRDNSLPWKLSTDLKRFKALTMGKPMVMGRKCFASIGKPLPGRPNIVVTRNPDFRPEGVIVVHSVEEGLRRAEAEAAAMGVDEICVIGGGQIYRETMAKTDVLHVTYVEADVEGDVTFPAIDPDAWHAGPEENVPKGEKDEYSSRFVTYRRRRQG